MEIKNKVVVITGGLGLIGRSIAKMIKDNQGVPIITDIKDSDEQSYYKMDISSKPSILETIQEIEKEYPKIDCLINSAYPRNKNYGRHFFDVELDDFNENLSMNLGSYFLSSQCFAQYFKAKGKGNIINIASIYGVVAPKFEIYENTKMTMPVEYACIKSGLIHLSRYMAKYLAHTGVRVNVVSPGGILDGQEEVFLDQYNSVCSSKGMLDAQDLNGAIQFLISDGSKYINGQNIIVDDGFSL